MRKEKISRRGDAATAWERGELNGQTFANALMETLETSGVRELKNDVCFAMLAARVDEWNSVEAFVGRGASEEEYQNLRASWRRTRLDDAETSERYRRCAAAYRRGLSLDVLRDVDPTRFFPDGASRENVEREIKPSNGAEDATAIWGRVGVSLANLPSVATLSTRCFYVGVERTNVDGGVANVGKPTPFQRSGRTFRNSPTVDRNRQLTAERQLTLDEFAEGLIDATREVVAKLGFVDAFGRPCAVDYQMPIFLRDKFFGWARVGFSKRPTPERLANFWNAVYRLASSVYDARPALDARRLLTARRERLRLTQKLVEGGEVGDYAALIQSALDEPICAKYRSTLCFLEATVPNLGVGGERMTVDFEAGGGKNKIAGKLAKWFDENRARVLTTGSTAIFQQGFRGVENDDFERMGKALVALPSEPQGATEEIRKREKEAIAKIGEMFPKTPKATARVVESRYGDERYFVATRIDKTIEALKGGGDVVSSNVSSPLNAEERAPLSAKADPTSHALKKIDVSPAYGVWAMFGSAEEIGMRDESGRPATTVVGIPFVFDDATYRVFAFFSTDGSNDALVGEDEVETFDLGYFDDLVETLHSVILELRLLKNSVERERLQAKTRNASAAYQEGHSAAKRHGQAVALAKSIKSAISSVAWVCVRDGAFDEKTKQETIAAYTEKTGGKWDTLGTYNTRAKLVGKLEDLWKAAEKLQKTNERLVDLSVARDVVGRALRFPEKPEKTFLTQGKSDWRSNEPAPLSKLLDDAKKAANEDGDASEATRLELTLSDAVKQTEIAPFIEDEGGRLWRPANFFYVTAIAELLLNARKRGEKRANVRVEEIEGRGRAVVLSNAATGLEKIPNRWTSGDDMDFTGGLREKHAQLSLTNAGEIFVRAVEGAFEVAVVLKGLSLKKQ